MNENRGSKLWLFILGFLFGALAGVLLAPEKGEVSRKKLKKKAQEIKGKYQEVLAEVKDKVEPVAEKVVRVAKPVFKKIEEVENLAKEELVEAEGENEPLATFDTRTGDFTPQAPTESAKPTPPHRRLLFRNLH